MHEPVPSEVTALCRRYMLDAEFRAVADILEQVRAERPNDFALLKIAETVLALSTRSTLNNERL